MAAVLRESCLEKAQVSLAVPALLKYLEKTKGKSLHLLNETEIIWLLLALKKIPDPSRKPKRIPLPNPLYSTTTDVCFISKDKASSVKELLAKHDIKTITKVLNIQKLKKNYKSYESRRQLLAKFDLFLCDDRIYHFLPRLLGKEFFRKKRFPLPIDLSKTKLDEEINKAMSCTLLEVGHGSCSAVKIAHTGMKKSQVMANIIEGVSEIAKIVPRGWKNIQSLNIKTTDSIALPIYTSLPEQEAIEETEETTAEKNKTRKRKSKENRGKVMKKKIKVEENKNIEKVPSDGESD